jgi:hypothetical protein
MSSSEIIAQMKQDVGASAILNNTIVAPVRNAGDAGDFQVTFNSYIPKQVQYYSYGVTVTLSVQFDNSPAVQIPLTPGGYKILNTPSGTKAINASIIGAPTLLPGKNRYGVCVTFN